MKLSKQQLIKEIGIAPQAIPISPDMIEQQAIDIKNLPIAESISHNQSFKICSENNRPKKAEIKEELDRILSNKSKE